MSTPRMKIRIDDEMVFRGTIGEWETRPPDRFRDAIKQGAAPQPWMKAILVTVADAVMMERSVNITVKTKYNGWWMDVKHT